MNLGASRFESITVAEEIPMRAPVDVSTEGPTVALEPIGRSMSTTNW